MLWGGEHMNFLSEDTHTAFHTREMQFLLFCRRVGWLNAWPWLPLLSYWQTQHARYVTSSAWTVWLVRLTPLQRTLTESERFPFLMEEAHDAPQRGALPPRSTTSAIRRQLWRLPRFPGVSQSPWCFLCSAPLKCGVGSGCCLPCVGRWRGS